MPEVFVSVGSNIEPGKNVRRALLLLNEQINIIATSTFYLTAPLGKFRQPLFFNGVIKVATEIPPLELKMSVLRKIEALLGRERTQNRFAPRPIDLDLIIYGGLVIRENGLSIPDPEIYERPFLGLPLLELSPRLVMPDSGIPLTQVVAGLDGNCMVPLQDYTAALRKELANEPGESGKAHSRIAC